MKEILGIKHAFFGCIVAVLVTSTVFGQNREVQQSNLYKHYQMKYIFANKYNDADAAKDALYSMLALDPSDDSLKMRLSIFYFENGNYASSLFSSGDVLARNPENADALRINAMSYDRMGVKDKAIAAYESLYLKSNEIGVLYQAAVLQYELERYNEAITNLDIIIKHPQAKVQKLSFGTESSGQQEVLMEAAAHNVKGMILNVQGKKEEARATFERALEVTPGFELAQNNLKEL
jgi:tetratricopeptide (TPR) repeat protein